MKPSQRPNDNDVNQLLLNARLRDELEPYVDDSLQLVDVARLPTAAENEYLASMLAWEKAPVLPISHWFDPPLVLPHPDEVPYEQLSELLAETLQRLYDRRIVLDHADHLSDRQLYCLIYRDILPSHEKKIDLPKNYLHWDCTNDDAETWLRYYATPADREAWAEEFGDDLPPADFPPYPRNMPHC